MAFPVLKSGSIPTLRIELKKDGWMTCDFTSYLTVFQSYQDDGRSIIKGCVQWNHSSRYICDLGFTVSHIVHILIIHCLLLTV